MAGDVMEQDRGIRSETSAQVDPQGRVGSDPQGRVGSDPEGPHPQDPAAFLPRADASEAARLLADLQEAGLVSHVARGTRPAGGQGETATLEALCALIAGSIYRIDAFHYAFRLAPTDVEAALDARPFEAWACILEAALARHAPGPALRVQPLAPLAPPAPEAGPEAGSEDLGGQTALWLLRAWDGAVAQAIAPAGAGTHAVINAHFAAETARLTARLTAARTAQMPAPAGDTRPSADLARRLEGLETQIATLAETCAVFTQSLERAQAENADFRRTLGRAFAEFLAQIDARDLRDREASAEADPLQAG